ncbi:MAG: hypothetical protein QMC80_07510 [Thermoplasmatales archaeon]|nr:hypothetical protein [Thermoplasmatales archaeon]
MENILPPTLHALEDHLTQYYHPQIKHITNIFEQKTILCSAHPAISTVIRALISIQIDFYFHISPNMNGVNIAHLPNPITFSSRKEFAYESPTYVFPYAAIKKRELADIQDFFDFSLICAPRWIIEQLRHSTALYHELMHKITLFILRAYSVAQHEDLTWLGSFWKKTCDKYGDMVGSLGGELLPEVDKIFKQSATKPSLLKRLPSYINLTYKHDNIAGTWAGYYLREIVADCAGSVLFCGSASIHSFANRHRDVIVEEVKKKEDFKSGSTHPPIAVRIWYMIKALDYLGLKKLATDCKKLYYYNEINEKVQESHDPVTLWIKDNLKNIYDFVSFVDNGKICLSHRFKDEEALIDHWKKIIEKLAESDVLPPDMMEKIIPADILNAMWYYLLHEEEYQKNNIKISRLAWRIALSSWLKNNISTYINTYLPKEEEKT